jgi:hypothetical protein
MSSLIYNIGNRYSNDITNFNEWFKDEMEHAKSGPTNVNVITYIMKKLRLSPGLVDTIGFLNDIYDELGMSVDYINIMHVKPQTSSVIWTSKMRTKPLVYGVDNMYDPALPTRNVMMFVPLTKIDGEFYIRWLSQADSDNVVGPNEEQAKGHVFPEHFNVTTDAFLSNMNRKCFYDNRANNEHFYWLLVGFEGNPSFEEVKAKFETLK